MQNIGMHVFTLSVIKFYTNILNKNALILYHTRLKEKRESENSDILSEIVTKHLELYKFNWASTMNFMNTSLQKLPSHQLSNTGYAIWMLSIQTYSKIFYQSYFYWVNDCDFFVIMLHCFLSILIFDRAILICFLLLKMTKYTTCNWLVKHLSV